MPNDLDEEDRIVLDPEDHAVVRVDPRLEEMPRGQDGMDPEPWGVLSLDQGEQGRVTL